jgi:lipoprotein-anchoring transpeptidase ErfK/SrfK
MTEDSKMNRLSALRASVSTGALFRAVFLTAAGIIAAATPADAALYYWRDSDPGMYGYAEPPQRARPPQRVRRAPKKQETKVKEPAVHPQLPLVIAVSIGSQRVRIYDANGFFAEAPVSTGMPGHPTPMGVFSVIEKDRYHHSNIYSGAPMPFMQRITWGGVALHAGVLPGYPASHGCIRMPNDFATKMWGWTKLGARVFVTPGDLPAPASFSHPFLAAYKVAPQPVVAEPPADAKVGPKADLGAAETKPVDGKLDLRPTLGHDKPADAAATRTADAGSKTTVTMTDAGGTAPKPVETADAAGIVPAKAGETTGEAKPNVAGAAAKHDEVPEQKVAEAKPVEATLMAPETGAKPEQPVTADKAEGDDAKPERTASADAKGEEKPEAKTEAIKTETIRTEAIRTEAKTDEAPKAAEAPKAVEPAKTVDVKAEPKLGAVDAPETAETPKADAKPDAAKVDVAKPADAKPAKKDETRVALPGKVAKEPPKRAGQIAVFISGKDSKLYVRQNFQPLFDVPVTIASSDRPLGTHVFTAQVDKEDSNVLHWSVVTVPMSRALRREESRQRAASRGKHKGAPPPPPVEAKPQIMSDSPAEALDRITVPPEAMARIAEALTSGGSIIVADQSIKQGETGEYTDFILSLR